MLQKMQGHWASPVHMIHPEQDMFLRWNSMTKEQQVGLPEATLVFMELQASSFYT